MKKIILSLVILTLVFVGCKKEDTNKTNTTSNSVSSTPKILKEYEYNILNDSIILDSSIITYSYDDKGRLATIKEDNYTESYTYVSANLINVSRLYYENDGTLKSGKYSIILDSKGLATKHYVDEKDTLFLYYTSDGFLKGNKIDHIIEVFGGNVIKETNASYEYYIDKNNTIGNENRGIYFLGKDSKNLVKSAKYTGTTVTTVSKRKRSTSDYSYTYEFDSKNRVIKSTKASSTNQIVVFPSGLAGTQKRVTKYEYIN
jgi:hypothetical protein